jgi:gas vesicle protein
MSKSNGTLIAFLAGAAAGAILGVLYAPDKGKNTRDKLSFQLEKYRDTLKEMLEEFMNAKDHPESGAPSESQKIVNEAKQKAENLLGDIETLINQIRNKNE